MLARGYAYWMNINRDIEEVVRHCRNCQEAAKMPKKTGRAALLSEENSSVLSLQISGMGPRNGWRGESADYLYSL
ncbi:hypothetical protein NECAME_10539 [Necator americanus]|uniref:Integrase zinc-binding domain-containing protein n=1 Tax=Necator americanus TaxID=51031 RepID=W2T976_NECAM|nr:hypothetical protein NECAME_10539 [Necator americanus]ETN78164.1 hypothetical protein NECAME_10539 [Necator americanus]